MSTAPSPTQDQTSKPFEMTLGDGTVVKGANMEEAFQTLAKMKVDTAAALRSARDEASRYQQERDALQQQVSKRPEPETNGFSKERYYQLLNEDPISAQNYMDQSRFGTPDPVGAFAQMRQSLDVLNRQNVVASFLAQHQDFPGTPDAARALTQRFEDLSGNGFPVSVDTLNYAYQQAIADGTIKPADNKPNDEPPPPNPSLRGASGINESDITKAESMNDEDLRKFMRSKGMNV